MPFKFKSYGSTLCRQTSDACRKEWIENSSTEVKTGNQSNQGKKQKPRKDTNFFVNNNNNINNSNNNILGWLHFMVTSLKFL